MGDQAGRKHPPRPEPRKMVFDTGRVWWHLAMLGAIIALGIYGAVWLWA